MRRRTFVRDFFGTIGVFVLLLVVVFIFILGELFLENFKVH